jgi:hypothetical protein
MLEDRKKSVHFLKESSSKWLRQIMKHPRKHERSADNSFYSSMVRVQVLSQSASATKLCSGNAISFATIRRVALLMAETPSLEFFAPNLGDLVRG